MPLGDTIAPPPQDEAAADTPQDTTTQDTIEPATDTTATTESPHLTYDTLLSHIPEDLRQEKIFQNINKENPVEDLARQFFHSQKLVGVDKIEAPKEDWPKDKWDSLYDRLGRPATPDEYKAPDFGEGVQIDEPALKEFFSLAHENGINQKQAEAILGYYGKYIGEKTSEITTGQQEAIKKQMLDFQAELGDRYGQFLSEAEAGLKLFADEPLQQVILGNPELSNNPAVIRHFQKLAQMAREDAARTGDSSNPLNINSPEQAITALKRFEEENKGTLFKAPDTLNLRDKEAREKLIRRRAELYKIAYGTE